MDEHNHSIDNSPFLHVANILYLLSYSVRDILWLRILTVLAMLCLGWVYWYCEQHKALSWQTAFLLINLFQIALLIYERRPVKLTEVQQELHAGPLQTLSPRQVQRFTDKASWQTAHAGEVILREDSELEHLVLLLSGEAQVLSRGKQIATLSHGQFAGEMSFLTGGRSTASVIASNTVLYAIWSKQYIVDVMQRDHDLGRSLQAALGTDLVQKLIKVREEHPKHIPPQFDEPIG